MTPAPPPPNTPPLDPTEIHAHIRATGPKPKAKAKPQRVRANTSPHAILTPGTHYPTLDHAPLHVTGEDCSLQAWQQLRLCERFVVHAGTVGYVCTKKWQFVALTPTLLRSMIERYLVLEAWPKPIGGAGPEPVRQVCSLDLASLILANPLMPAALSGQFVPDLKAVAPHALADRTGIYSGKIMHEGGSVSYAYKRKKGVVARDVRELFTDFPMSLESQATILAGMVAMLFRPWQDGNSPLFVVTSPSERSGKTKMLEDVVGCVILGYPIPMSQWPQDETEVDKRMLAMGIAKINAACFDNVPSKLDSPCLASNVTCDSFAGRVLQQSNYVQVPNRMTLWVTGNHVECSSEIAKRCLMAVINTGVENPELRTGFLFKDLRGQALAHRDEYLEWFYQMIEKWIAMGCPPCTRPFGGFEKFGASVLGVIEHAIGLPILGDREERVSDMDRDGQDLKHFVEAWWNVYGGEGVTASELLAIAQSPAVRAWEGSLAMAKVPVIALARHLATYVDRTVGDFRIARQGTGSRRVYYLKPVAPSTYPQQEGV